MFTTHLMRKIHTFIIDNMRCFNERELKSLVLISACELGNEQLEVENLAAALGLPVGEASAVVDQLVAKRAVVRSKTFPKLVVVPPYHP